MTPHWSASSRTVTSLLTDRRLSSWLSGAVLTTWSLTCSKQWRWSWTSGEPPLLSPPLTIMNSTVTAEESFRFLGTTISQDLKWDDHIESIVKKAQQRLYFLRQLRKFNLPQELLIQFYSAIIESVLCTSITVWFSWANHWYNPPYSPRTVLTQSEQKGWQNHSGPLTSSTLTLWTVTVWSTLQSSEHQNDQTQEQFLPSSNPSHEYLTLNVEHTNTIYIIYSSHTGVPLRILGPLDSIFTRAHGVWLGIPREVPLPEPVFFSPSPKSDYTVSAITFVQFCK